MSIEEQREEQRLAQLLKRAVPEPRFELSADQVTAQRVDRSIKSWALPAGAAAAVLVIGLTVGAVATHNSSRATPGAAQGTPRSAASPATGSTNSASPATTPSRQAQGNSVVVPNLVGQSPVSATAIAQRAGFIVKVVQAKSPSAQPMPPGTVFAESPSAGTAAPRGAMLTIYVAMP